MRASEDRIYRRRLIAVPVVVLALSSGALATAPKSYAQASTEPDPAVEQTLASIRSLGSALLSWYTDSTSAAAAGAATGAVTTRVDDFSEPLLSLEEIEALLVPSYLEAVPTQDGWGHPLEIRVATHGETENLFFIRSPGRDGKFTGQSYESYRFPAEDLDHDIVWADGYFVCWPSGSGRTGED